MDREHADLPPEVVPESGQRAGEDDVEEDVEERVVGEGGVFDAREGEVELGEDVDCAAKEGLADSDGKTDVEAVGGDGLELRGAGHELLVVSVLEGRADEGSGQEVAVAHEGEEGDLAGSDSVF